LTTSGFSFFPSQLLSATGYGLQLAGLDVAFAARRCVVLRWDEEGWVRSVAGSGYSGLGGREEGRGKRELGRRDEVRIGRGEESGARLGFEVVGGNGEVL